ncbi:MAG: glycosyltransferase family 39 protein, partial [Pseudomonadota bacterium]
MFVFFKTLWRDDPIRVAMALVISISLLRLCALFFYQSSLGPDEAQYWFWSQRLDWGYYSKPPMIAWVIALPTALLGDHVWVVRFLSPLLIGGTAILLMLTGRRLYDDHIGAWAGLLWLTLPAVLLGTTIISTDIPLLFFWSLSLYALVGLSQSKGPQTYGWAILLGAGLGLGLLSKYAMIYFFVGWGGAILISDAARKSLKPLPLLVAAVVAASFFTPNLLWNAQNGFQTLSHTADNANWGRQLLNPGELWA